MKCSYCQQEIAKNVKECPYCGTPILEENISALIESPASNTKQTENQIASAEEINTVNKMNYSQSPIVEKESSSNKGCLLFIIGVIVLIIIINPFKGKNEEKESGKNLSSQEQNSKIEKENNPGKINNDFLINNETSTDTPLYENVGVGIFYNHNRERVDYSGKLYAEDGIYRFEGDDKSALIVFSLDGSMGCTFSAYFNSLKYENISGLYDKNEDEEDGYFLLCDLSEEISLYFYLVKPFEFLQLFEDGRYDLTIVDNTLGWSGTLSGTITYMDGAHCFLTDDKEILVAFILSEEEGCYFSIRMDGEENFDKTGWYEISEYENETVLTMDSDDAEVSIGVCQEGQRPWD